LEEQAEMRNVPKINSDFQSKSKRPRIPVHERPIPTTDFDDLLGKQRKIRPSMAEDEEDLCTFQPELTAKNGLGRRSVDDLLKWGTDKRFKMIAPFNQISMRNQREWLEREKDRSIID